MERLKGNLDLLLLSIIAASPAYGYQIICQLRDRSDGTFDLPEGTVYPALHRMEKRGLLASRTAVFAGRPRRIYRITPSGERTLGHERDQWFRFVDAVATTLGSAPI